MYLKPLDNRVVVRRFEPHEKTPGGILIPEVAKKKSQKGRVVSVGSGKLLKDGTRCKMQVKVGDVVFFPPYIGTEVEVGDREYLVLSEEDLLAVEE